MIVCLKELGKILGLAHRPTVSTILSNVKSTTQSISWRYYKHHPSDFMFAHHSTTGGFVSGEIKHALTLQVLGGAMYLDCALILRWDSMSFNHAHKMMVSKTAAMTWKWILLCYISPIHLMALSMFVLEDGWWRLKSWQNKMSWRICSPFIVDGVSCHQCTGNMWQAEESIDL